MKACVVTGAKSLVLEDMPVPKAAPGGVIVKLGAGGICGSDLHYYNEGRVGDFQVRQPLILGHEVAGDVVEVGPDVKNIAVGDRVVVNPSLPCGICRQCRAGRPNICTNTLFYGSAARFPHVQGAFREFFPAREEQCIPVSRNLPLAVAACAEPLAVSLHAVKQAGNILGKRVLVTGAGPIGLMVLLACRLAGALEIVITDLFDVPLQVALQLGASSAINVRQNPGGMDRFCEDDGYFHAAIEASGSLAALGTCVLATEGGGRIVQLGIPSASDHTDFNQRRLITREIDLVGSFRFSEEFEESVRILESRRIDPSPFITAEIPLSDALHAFTLASDRSRAVKVSLVASV